MLSLSAAARADIIHAYVPVESKNVNDDALRQGVGAHLGMCKYVVVGTVATDEIGVTQMVVRLDCQETADLNALVARIGGDVDGVTRMSLLD